MNIFGINKPSLGKSEKLWVCNEALFRQKHSIIGITRVRNESLILADTLNHMASHVDAIVAYDDASTDHTLDILRSHPKVAFVVADSIWQAESMARQNAETRQRDLLLKLARSKLRFDWVFCFDADERYIGDIRAFAQSKEATECDGVRVRLFDAYMTADDCAPYADALGQELINFRKFFGPERRDILMLWKNRRQVRFEGPIAREPLGVKSIRTDFYCQHYGKALSVKQWDETCDFYIKYFPYETYGRKWQSRKGKAIHTESDFGRPLYPWGETLFSNAVLIS